MCTPVVSSISLGLCNLSGCCMQERPWAIGGFRCRWESSGFFRPDESATGEPFTMSMPPPNVTGRLHMGHAMFVTLQDIMARYQRMRGRPTLWLPGTDHAGIATQVLHEQRIETYRQDYGWTERLTGVGQT